MQFYRLLLRLYPASFRMEYGDELEAAFAMHRAGSVASVFLAIADVVPNALAVHWDILQQDLRYAARSLRRAPGFALTAVLVVALGVGANTAAFSVADFVLLRPLPFPQPDRLVTLWERTPGYPTMELSPGNYKDWKASAKSFSAMGGYMPNAMNLVSGNEPRRVQTAQVTADLLPLLGVRPYAGRLFTHTDTVTGLSVIVSYDLWQTHFGGDPALTGASINLDGKPYTVVGVMPPDFHFPNRDVALWTTVGFDEGDFRDRADNYLNVVARLADGVTVERAGAELDVIAKRLEREYPKANQNTGATLSRMSDDVSERTRLLLLALCGAALCALLLACANLASLLLARAVEREREIAVRAALGAGRERLVRQLVTESVVLAIVGGLVGVGVAVVAVPGLAALVPTSLPIAQRPSVDLRVLLFAALLIGVTGFAFGVVPAMRAGSPRAVAALRDGVRAGGGRRQPVRAMLVMVEVMTSVALLTASGLLVRAMWRIQAVDTGFTTDGVLTLRTALPFPKYTMVVRRDQFYTAVLTQVRGLPGVSSAAFTTSVPLGSFRGGIWPVITRGQEPVRTASNSASLRYITPGFFETLRIPIRQGRDVAVTDDAGRPFIAVVSESFARRYWPNEDPIGKHFQFAFHDRMVAGVAGDVRMRGLERASEPQVYIPAKQVADSSLLFYAPKDLMVRSSAPVAALLPEIRRIVHAADPQQPVSNVMTMDDVVAGETASRLAQLRVLGILALVALLLASVGLHGLLSFTVSSRMQEIGVRVALGAESAGIARMILAEGAVLAAGGLVPGVLLAYGAGRAMQALLAGVRPGDPLTFAAAVAISCLTALFGALRPALRAARVDPATALRGE